MECGTSLGFHFKLLENMLVKVIVQELVKLDVDLQRGVGSLLLIKKRDKNEKKIKEIKELNP